MSIKEQLQILQESIDLIDSMSKEEYQEFLKSKGYIIPENNNLLCTEHANSYSAKEMSYTVRAA